MILRGLYMLWLIGAVVVLSRGLSQILFGSSPAGLRQLLRAVFMAVVWPIAMLTPEGRAALRALARSG